MKPKLYPVNFHPEAASAWKHTVVPEETEIESEPDPQVIGDPPAAYMHADDDCAPDGLGIMVMV